MANLTISVVDAIGSDCRAKITCYPSDSDGEPIVAFDTSDQLVVDHKTFTTANDVTLALTETANLTSPDANPCFYTVIIEALNGTRRTYTKTFTKTASTETLADAVASDSEDLSGYARPGGWHDVKAYGAVGDGITNDNAAFQAAFAAALAANGTMFMPPGRYLITEKIGTITDTMEVRGSGPRISIITSTMDDWVLEVQECYRAGEETSAETAVDYSVFKGGVILRDFSISNDRANATKGIQFIGRNDVPFMEAVDFLYINGPALWMGVEDPSSERGFVRESLVRRVRVQGCGSSSAAAMLVTNSATQDATDGTNQITFEHLDIVYNIGTGLHLKNESTTETIRRINIRDLMLHGLGTAASAPAKDLMLIEGKIQAVLIDGCKTNSSNYVSATSYAAIRIRDLDGNPGPAASYRPQKVQIAGFDQSNHKGHGIVAEDCRVLLIEGTSGPDSIDGYELDVGADVGFLLNNLWAPPGDTRDFNGMSNPTSLVGFKDSDALAVWYFDDMACEDLVASGAIVAGVGSSASPSYRFAGDDDTGIYQNAAEQISFSVTGARVLQLEAALMRLQDATHIAVGSTTGTKFGTGPTQKIGFWNTTPVVQDTGWGSITNVSTDRAYDANATSTDELADVLGTLIATLVTYGILGS